MKTFTFPRTFVCLIYVEVIWVIARFSVLLSNEHYIIVNTVFFYKFSYKFNLKLSIAVTRTNSKGILIIMALSFLQIKNVLLSKSSITKGFVDWSGIFKSQFVKQYILTNEIFSISVE